MPKIALYGRPGSGKSTFSALLAQELTAAGAEALPLKLAESLYELQGIIYAMAGCPLLDHRDQDGQLLNALGFHVRRINRDALTEPFTRRVRHAEQVRPQAVLLCDDMRAPDAMALIALGFRLVHVTAPDSVRMARKQARADLSDGDDHHCTEAPVKAVPWRRVSNAGTVDDLREQAARLAGEIVR